MSEKVAEILDALSKISTAEWDERLRSIGKQWLRTYHLRQIKAIDTGDTSAPPPPPEPFEVPNIPLPPSQRPRKRLIDNPIGRGK